MRVPWMWEGVREKAALERALPKAHRWQKTRDEKNSKMHNFYIHCQMLWMMQVTCVILATCVVKDSSCTGTWRGTCTATLESSRTLAGERKGYFPPTTLPRWKCGAIFASYGGRMKHERAQVIKSMINKNLVGWRIWQIVKAKSGSSKYKWSSLVNRLR